MVSLIIAASDAASEKSESLMQWLTPMIVAVISIFGTIIVQKMKSRVTKEQKHVDRLNKKVEDQDIKIKEQRVQLNKMAKVINDQQSYIERLYLHIVDEKPPPPPEPMKFPKFYDL